MPGNYPEESIQHSEHGRSLKSRVRVHAHLCVVYPVTLKEENARNNSYVSECYNCVIILHINISYLSQRIISPYAKMFAENPY